jgi:hypothetical protein
MMISFSLVDRTDRLRAGGEPAGPIPHGQCGSGRHPVPGQAQEIGSKSAQASSKQSGSAKTPARKPMRKPDGTGNFVYGIINTIRVQSAELCARYGNPADCLEEAEVCLTMRDNDDNQVRLCLNTVPEDSGDQGSVQKSRLRR